MSEMTPVVLNNLSYDFTRLRISGWPGTTGSLLRRMIKKVNFSDTVSPAIPKGVHGIALPSGLGSYSTSTSLSVQFEAWEELLAGLKSVIESAGGYTAIQFDLTVEYRNRANPQPSRAELKESRIIGVSDAYSEGDASGLMTDLTLYTRYILRNGVCLFPLDLDSAT